MEQKTNWYAEQLFAVLPEHLTSELLTESMIGAQKPWPYEQLLQQIIHKWRCSRTFMYTIYILFLIDIMPALVYTIIVLENGNTSGDENKFLRMKKNAWHITENGLK